jgi:hypothetical protein
MQMLVILRNSRACARYRVLILTSVLISAALPSPARIRSVRHNQELDPDYVSALATANRFLYAWQTHDQETGLLLLTNTAKKSTSEDRVTDFFSSNSPVTYEISRGTKSKPGQYVFPIALYDSATMREKRCRPRYSRITVIRTGKEDWAIDTLP